VFSSWYADYLDPQNFLSMLLTTGAAQNTEGWSNPLFDALCAKADADPNQSSRIKTYQDAEDIAVQDGAKLTLYFQRDAILVSPRVTGIRTNLFGDLPDLEVHLK
jgi:oligopeptide transport system substrate-binding protein